METKPLQWNIYQTIERKEKIDPQPQYQRTPVWDENKKQLLIDSILQNYVCLSFIYVFLMPLCMIMRLLMDNKDSVQFGSFEKINMH